MNIYTTYDFNTCVVSLPTYFKTSLGIFGHYIIVNSLTLYIVF